MNARRHYAGVVGLTLTALVSTSVMVVAAAPAAHAARGDQATFPVGGNLKRTYSIAVVGDRLWATATENKALVSITTAGAATVHPLPATFPAGVSLGIAAGPGGRVWFTEFDNAAVSSVDANGGDLKRHTILKGSKPVGIAAGSDGAMWYAVQGPDRISRLAPNDKTSDFFVGTKLGMSGIASNGADGMVFTTFEKGALGLITLAGKTRFVTIPDGDPTDVAVGPDGTIWVAPAFTGLAKVSPSGKVTPVPSKGGSVPLAVTVAGDGSAWWVGTGGRIGRAAPDGSVEEFTLTFQPRDLVAGPDGNLWVTADNASVIMRVLSGIVPEVTNLPVLMTPGGSSFGVGTVVTATDGTWKYQPTTLARQWQRCASSAGVGCADIPGATGNSYTVTDADLGGFLRVNVTASNLNGPSKPASSDTVKLAPKPADPGQPTQPAGPTPVAGAGTVTLAPGVTAKIVAPTKVSRGAKRTYKVTFTSPKPRGAVRFALVDAAGAEAYVISPATAVKGTKKFAYASKKARVPKAVPKGVYTLVAVFTPTAKQVATYPVATLTRGITLR